MCASDWDARSVEGGRRSRSLMSVDASSRDVGMYSLVTPRRARTCCVCVCVCVCVLCVCACECVDV